MGNWPDYEVAAAARGASFSGSASKVAAELKQDVVDYAGQDLTLGGDTTEDKGVYELTLESVINDLNTQKTEAQASLDLLSSNLAIAKSDMENDKTVLQTNITNTESAITTNKTTVEQASSNYDEELTIFKKAAETATIDLTAPEKPNA